jgi:hypothetical protein
MSIVTYNNRSIANISAIPGAAKSLTHIKTLTASSSATISFVDGSSDVVLDSTYPIYVFKFINLHPSSDNAQLTFQGSTDSGSNYNTTITSTTFRTYHKENGTGATLTYVAGFDQAQGTSYQYLTGGIGNDNDQSVSGDLYIFNPSSTTFVKHFTSTLQMYETVDFSESNFNAGYFNTTSSIDAFSFKMHSGNIDAGTIKLYGIKDS